MDKSIQLNKRGDGISVPQLVGLLMAFFVLVVIGYFIFTCSKSQCGGTLLNILPGFNQGRPDKVTGVQIIGYDLIRDKSFYYTGKDWLELEKEVQLDEKSVGPAAGLAIKNFYYSDSSRSSDSGQSYSIDFKYPAGEALRIEEGFWGGLGRRTLNGIKSVIRSENQVQQKKLENAAHIQMDNGLNLYISPDEKVYAKTISDGVVALVPDSVKSQYSSQISAVREWKDSILQGHKDAKTVSITYLDNNLGKTKQEKRFCVERKDPYLIVHLDSPVSGDGACK